MREQTPPDRNICHCRKNPCICLQHDAQCEAELTSHGYTPCRCEERAEPFAEQLSRVESMTDDEDWDLSDNDRAALKALLKERTALSARCTALEQEIAALRAELAHQADRDRFDRDLAHFSKGYTEAVTDVTGELRPKATPTPGCDCEQDGNPDLDCHSSDCEWRLGLRFALNNAAKETR